MKLIQLVFTIILLIGFIACNSDSTVTKNQAPVANAGVDKNISEGTTILFDGSKSQDDGKVIKYEWKLGSTILSKKVKFRKDDLSIGKHIITLTVTDDTNLTNSDTIIINISRKIISEKDYFITTWLTSNSGISDINELNITVSDKYTYNYWVDWGDGKVDYNITGNALHTYNKEGKYQVKIYGKFPAIYFNPKDATFSSIEFNNQTNNDSQKLISIDQWGTIKWESMYSAFCGCCNMTGNTTDIPDLFRVKDMSNMFYHALKFNQDISSWDVSSVTNMSGMFVGVFDDLWSLSQYSSFNKDISSWDVSNVTDMSNMFKDAFKFNQDISSWNVSNVTNMKNIFSGALSFNQDISKWDVSKVTNMSGMFVASAFNQNIDSWDVSNVTDMSLMFSYYYEWMGSAFNQDISSWDVSNVTNMSDMFSGNINFNQDISSWDVSNVTNMSGMFLFNKAFNKNISSWDVGNVTNMRNMFNYAKVFNQDIGSWNVSKVTDMSNMFFFASKFNQDISSWNVSNITNMYGMFLFASKFNQNIGSWDVSSVLYMNNMFKGNYTFNQDISSWDVSNVTDMSNMFWGCRAFNQDLGSWDIKSVKYMSYMFNKMNLSTSNYSNILREWSQKDIQYNVEFSGGASKYNRDVSIDRERLINDYNWTITDGGLDQNKSR